MMEFADFGEAINVRFARTEIAALDRVVEKPVNAVAVVRIILRGVDSALGGDAVRAARAVLVTERLHVVALLAEGGRGRAAGQAGADDDDLEFPAIVRRDQPGVILVLAPFLRQRAGGNFGFERADHEWCSQRSPSQAGRPRESSCSRRKAARRKPARESEPRRQLLVIQAQRLEKTR